MTRLALIPLLFGTGCFGTPGGTSVGNPTSMALRVAGSRDVVLDLAEIPVQEVTLYYTDRTWETLAIDDVLDATQGDTLDLPNGEWASLVLIPDAPLALSGQTRSGDLATLILDVADIRIVPRTGSVVFEDDAFVLELAFPSWLDEENAGYDPDAEVLVEPGDRLHAGLVSAVRDGTTLFADDDVDRQVSEEERGDRDQAGGRPR